MIKYKKSPYYRIVTIADEYIAIPVGKNIPFKGVVALSEPAFFMLSYLDILRSREELIEMLMKEYDVGLSVVTIDLDNIIKTLLDIGLVEECESDIG